MSDFFRKEFAIRPVLMEDPELESVIIRRGSTDRPRVLHGFHLENEEVVGKREGEIVGFPWPFGETANVIVAPSATEVIHRYKKIKSQHIKVDVDTVDGALGQSFLSLITAREDVNFNKFSILGDKISYTLDMVKDGEDIIVSLTNNHDVDLVCYVVIIG